MAWHSYYGNGYDAAQWPNSYREDNVTIITNQLRAFGWSDCAIAAICGNMQVESYLNPGQWQHGYAVGSASAGYGLVQWTPRTKYSDCAGSDWSSNWDKQTLRIEYELQNGLQWQATAAYPLTFQQFKTADETQYSVEYLARAFYYCYERGTILGQRETYARNWYNYIQGLAPSDNIPKWLLFKIKFENERRRM